MFSTCDGRDLTILHETPRDLIEISQTDTKKTIPSSDLPCLCEFFTHPGKPQHESDEVVINSAPILAVSVPRGRHYVVNRLSQPFCDSD